ncbi:hypothetical protein D3C75_933300 [compost metagenome]
MTDKELLKLAAKAAGNEVVWGRFGAGEEWLTEDTVLGGLRPWRPLTDDGDALRLAVKLGIETEFFSGTVYAGPRRTAKYSVDASETLDILAATRRAIVRAAAEIGRAMP